jgi:hypothetical protein
MTGATQPAEPLDNDVFEPNFADPPLIQGGVSTGIGSGPVDTRPQIRAGRRLEMLRGNVNRETATSRVLPGQLPTYERGYLMEELRRIMLISGALLAVVLILTVVLR